MPVGPDMIGSIDPSAYLQPWDVTGGTLPDFYGDLWDLYGEGSPDPMAPGDQIAPLNPAQISGYNQMTEFGQPGGAGAGFMDFLSSQLGQGLDMNQVAGYADNPYMDQMIDASLRDPYRQLTEQTLPGIDLGAAFGGNMDSSRAGLAEGVAKRGYGDRATDIAAQMRGGAYQQGMDTTLQTRNQDTQMAEMARGMGLGNIGAGIMGGGGFQNQDQQLRDRELANWGYNRDAPWQNSENYSNLAVPPSSQFGTQFGYNAQPSFGEMLQSMLMGNATGAVGGMADDLFGNIGNWMQDQDWWPG